MRYLSTRGGAPELNFEGALLAGLASDGGLYVPETLPKFSNDQLSAMADLSYPELAYRVIEPFVGDTFSDGELATLIDQAYADFRHSAVAPLVQLDQQQWILELFHGPTLAFKDFALQLLGRLLDAVLTRRGQKVVVLGATSGDTGSAAIAGCKACSNIDVFILYPHQRVSEVQRRQMTTQSSANVHNIALEGDFDDCQSLVKASFKDQAFLPDGRSLVAVNSINWARIVAQIVYYFYAGLALGAPHRPASYSVPTGNFGDIFAGYLAKQMGLPISQLMIATNRNNVLHRVLETGRYTRQSLHRTASPSMDITVSSNFERLLLDACGSDPEQVAQLMQDLNQGEARLSNQAIAYVRSHFMSSFVDDAETIATIREIHDGTGYLLDPHSAIGYAAARSGAQQHPGPWVTLATAHPAKFPEAIADAEVNAIPTLPAHMEDLYDLEEHFSVLPAKLSAVQQHIQKVISG
ncbi:MAG: threonine synthase [Pseudomonadota bacterium]